MITEVEMGKGGKEGFPGAGVFKALVRQKLNIPFLSMSIEQ